MSLASSIEDSIWKALVASSKDGDSNEWMTLNQLLSLVNIADQDVSDQHIGISSTKLVDPVENFVRRMREEGKIEFREDKPIYETEFRISKNENVNLGLYDEISDTSQPDITIYKTDNVDSTFWTGAKLTYIESGVLAELRATALKLQSMSKRINYVTDEDRDDLQSLCNALVALSAMAVPEVGIIDRVTSHPKFKIYAALFTIVATLRGALGI